MIRRGRVVGQRLPSETDEDDLAELMVGREVQLTVDRGESHPADIVLQARGLQAQDDRGRDVLPRASISRSGRARSWASPAWRATARTSRRAPPDRTP